MKKILLFILAIGIIISIDSQKIFSFFTPDREEVIGIVNNEEITFTDIESLYDLQHALISTSPPTVIQLQLEYAELLYKRIEQILITQELENRKLSITDEKVDAFESMIRKDYKEMEKYNETTFEEIVESNGTSYPFWKSQLKIRLEIERLEDDIAKNIIIDSDEIIKYVDDHPKLANIPDKFDFVVIRSSEKSKLEEIKKEKNFILNNVKELDLEMQRGLFEFSHVPAKYLKDLQKMKPHTFSEIQSENKKFYLLYLNAYENNQNPDALLLYSIAEKELLELKTPTAYDEWLVSALKKSKIIIAEDFLPKNLPSEDVSEGIYSILQDRLNPTLPAKRPDEKM